MEPPRSPVRRSRTQQNALLQLMGGEGGLRTLSLASLFAPAASRASTTSEWPFAAAKWSRLFPPCKAMDVGWNRQDRHQNTQQKDGCHY